MCSDITSRRSSQSPRFLLTICRYNLFIILYPLGVIGELMTIYAALPFVRRSGMYSMRLPNKYNVSFDYYYCLIIVMLSYIPRKEPSFLFFYPPMCLLKDRWGGSLQ